MRRKRWDEPDSKGEKKKKPFPSGWCVACSANGSTENSPVLSQSLFCCCYQALETDRELECKLFKISSYHHNCRSAQSQQSLWNKCSLKVSECSLQLFVMLPLSAGVRDFQIIAPVNRSRCHPDPWSHTEIVLICMWYNWWMITKENKMIDL